MKCNKILIIFSSLLPISCYAATNQGLGAVAENIIPHIIFGAYIAKVAFFALGTAFLAYSYTLWGSSRKNPLFVPRYKVLGSLIMALICFLMALMESDYELPKSQPIPILPTQRAQYMEKSNASPKKHWAKTKSIQNDN
ncbi:MAG: hypothetical protein FJ161_04730 [Gammaproteobacteria bacterium]|nr:hypothetical protein [Gammaproteobacteria bacterium]